MRDSSSGSPAPIKTVAGEWGAIMQAHIQSIYARNPRSLLRITRNGILATGLFGETDGTKLNLYRTRIALRANTGTPIQIEPPLAIKRNTTFALGRAQIFLEFFNQTSERARAEAERAAIELEHLTPEEQAIHQAIRLADLTIAHDPSGQVGGPVDVVELTRGGEIRWIQRKPECSGEQVVSR
jgi:hypothetical protein